MALSISPDKRRAVRKTESILSTTRTMPPARRRWEPPSSASGVVVVQWLAKQARDMQEPFSMFEPIINVLAKQGPGSLRSPFLWQLHL
ncbi:hypothetical protein PoB_004357500 [Plakobranchus ocellatus]|uniref:Uncharacterized protein n=1 Tax=Plakobranchus ocellatus TaxID=259542 RepID=A0AAV4BDA2_9GAST|nr:hypothetical protein PoB_004357500 [Plakobranchus ocellatus]